MRLLLDTHIFLWLLYQPEKVSRHHMAHLRDTDNALYLSAVSIAEIMIKHSLGKLDISLPSHDALVEILDQMGITLLDYDGASALHLGTLPFHHRDPFDRMIITQAIEHNLTIVTVDSYFQKYGCRLL
jgi:PIN domain nuclease of toxin-antitoxin system